MKLEQSQTLEMRQEMSQVLRMEQAYLLEMPESEFQSLIIEIEHNPLFQRFYRKERVIRYQRFPRTDISSGFYEVKEEMLPTRGSSDVESLLLNKEDIVRQIRKLGLEKFRRYFLLPESGMTLEEIAGECDLDVAEVRRINSLIDDFCVMSDVYRSPAVSPDGIRYSRVASVEKHGDDFIIGYFLPSFARGRYSVDYGRFEELATAGAMAEGEVKEARRLFKKLELVNSRKDTLTSILQNIVDKQSLFLRTGDPKCLLPLSQKGLAEKIGLAPSSVSRAISGKSIDTPWGQEVSLKSFFPRPRRFRKELLRQLLDTDKELSSDEAIRARLWERFGVAISRRSVANLRKELKIPAARGKRKPIGRKETR